VKRASTTTAARWAAVRAVAALACGVAVYRVRSHVPAGSMSAFVLGWLPDALWSFAIAQSVALVWAGGPRSARRAWHVAGFALAVGWELGQLIHLVPGTFDPWDLVASATAYLIAVAVSSRRLATPPLRATQSPS
jgi:hypothetical protein